MNDILAEVDVTALIETQVGKANSLMVTNTEAIAAATLLLSMAKGGIARQIHQGNAWQHS
jgi:hypothetical protein